MLITAFLHFRPEGHREPRNEFGSLRPAERLVGFERETFQFLLQCLNPQGHSPEIFILCLSIGLPKYIETKVMATYLI